MDKRFSNEFTKIDPYNNNEVHGYISNTSDETYGALIIDRVNNKEVPIQMIMGTPKMHYPFDTIADGTRKYRFPSVKNIEAYEKIDGTNILSYFYLDANGKRYMTFKTRLRPFLGSGKFGNFYSMWNEVAKDYFNVIKAVMQTNDCNLSFELFGKRNTHLIVYDTLLSFRALFGVTNNGNIIPPTKINWLKNSLPIVDLRCVIDKDYVYNYNANRNIMNTMLSKCEEDYYIGTEGEVWYLNYPDGTCKQIKCKPEIIEAIHFSMGSKGINRNVILATCWNALENTDDVTIDFVSKLLIEEFDKSLVSSCYETIEKCINFVIGEIKFRENVIDEYKNTNLNIIIDKKSIMRILSKKFNKKDMRKVYNIISNN